MLICKDSHTVRSLYSGMLAAIAAAMVFELSLMTGWPDGYWAMISVAAVFTGQWVSTRNKIASRIGGTLIGAAFGMLLIQLLGHHIAPVLITFIIFVTCARYIGMRWPLYSYASIITAITVVIIISSLITPLSFLEMAYYRTLQVLLGTVVTLVITAIGHRLFPQYPSNTAEKNFTPTQSAFHIKIWISAFQVALASTITLITWIIWQYPYGFWAVFSCLLTMEESKNISHNKMLLRFAAHAGIALFAGIARLLVGTHYQFLIVPFSIGFFIIGVMACSQKKWAAQIASTGGVAMAAMLAANLDGSDATFIIIASRFFNVLYGIAIGFLIINFLYWRKQKSAA